MGWGGKVVTLDMCGLQDEKLRIEQLGGVVVWYGAWRVNGVLSVARAIGDTQLKKYVTSECDVSATKIVGGVCCAVHLLFSGYSCLAWCWLALVNVSACHDL